MSKELKIKLFNIYDVVVFEDEKGITQDCVCSIGKGKEVDKIVDVIECNNHSISIYEDGSYKVWKRDGKDLPYYNTNKKIIHLYTLKNDNRFYEIYPTDDYEVIENADLSKAFERLERFFNSRKIYEPNNICIFECIMCLSTIKRSLLKSQETKLTQDEFNV